jgi:hypothetical protein
LSGFGGGSLRHIAGASVGGDTVVEALTLSVSKVVSLGTSVARDGAE